MSQMSHVLREHAIGMLTAEMSTRAVARELNVHLSTISHLQKHFREFGSTAELQTTCNHTSPGPPHPASSPPRSFEISHNAATIGLHNQRISAQTVKNHLREAHLHARRPHRGLELTTVCHHNRLEWANAQI